MLTMPRDLQEDVDLVEHGFFFALTAVDPRAGSMIVTHQSYDAEGSLMTRNIKLDDCKEFWADGRYEGRLAPNQQSLQAATGALKKKGKLLCPLTDSLKIRGTKGDPELN